MFITMTIGFIIFCLASLVICQKILITNIRKDNSVVVNHLETELTKVKEENIEYANRMKRVYAISGDLIHGIRFVNTKENIAYEELISSLGQYLRDIDIHQPMTDILIKIKTKDYLFPSLNDEQNRVLKQFLTDIQEKNLPLEALLEFTCSLINTDDLEGSIAFAKQNNLWKY